MQILQLGRSGHQTGLASAFWMQEGKTTWGHLKENKQLILTEDWQSNWVLQNHRCYFFSVMFYDSRRPMQDSLPLLGQKGNLLIWTNIQI